MKHKNIIALICGVLTLAMINSCNVKPEQVKVIAQSSGMFSAVGWIAIDNPSSNQIEVVKGILVVIEEKAADVEAGSTYTEVVYPELVKIIDEKMEKQYRPVCKAASLSLLGGLDILFAMHPEWKADQDLAIQVVNAFIVGAKNGFSLDESGAVMTQVRTMSVNRAKFYNK